MRTCHDASRTPQRHGRYSAGRATRRSTGLTRPSAGPPTAPGGLRCRTAAPADKKKSPPMVIATCAAVSGSSAASRCPTSMSTPSSSSDRFPSMSSCSSLKPSSAYPSARSRSSLPSSLTRASLFPCGSSRRAACIARGHCLRPPPAFWIGGGCDPFDGPVQCAGTVVVRPRSGRGPGCLARQRAPVPIRPRSSASSPPTRGCSPGARSARRSPDLARALGLAAEQLPASGRKPSGSRARSPGTSSGWRIARPPSACSPVSRSGRSASRSRAARRMSSRRPAPGRRMAEPGHRRHRARCQRPPRPGADHRRHPRAPGARRLRGPAPAGHRGPAIASRRRRSGCGRRH